MAFSLGTPVVVRGVLGLARNSRSCVLSVLLADWTKQELAKALRPAAVVGRSTLTIIESNMWFFG
jgi:hypothetical protein